LRAFAAFLCGSCVKICHLMRHAPAEVMDSLGCWLPDYSFVAEGKRERVRSPTEGGFVSSFLRQV
jgi:hypothetical protein